MKTKYIFLLGTILFIFSLAAHADGKWSTSNSNGFFGNRNYKIYVPNSLNKGIKTPIVVMLHGCDENIDDFARGVRIEKWADKEQFIALFPEQSTAYNPYRCWNWILPGNNSRLGESKAIVEMLDTVIYYYNGDADRVYAAGMSAGGAMAGILGNCYPERFKAIASHDGTQFFSSYVALDFEDVVKSGATVPFSVSANLGNACSEFIPNRPKKMPIIIFQGMNSPLMNPIHAIQVESEMKDFNDLLDNGVKDNSYFLRKEISTVPASATYGYTLYKTINREQNVLIERYMIDGLEHSWSGGVEGIPYNDPKGPDASALIFNFFGRYGL